MNTIFKCPNCYKAMSLPSCSCGYCVPLEKGIFQLTNDPYIVKDSIADIKYIGYEDIGEFYSGKSLYRVITIDDKHKKIAELIGKEPLLDLACGDGIYSVPLAYLGMKIIAMDISDKMLSLLKERAAVANIDASDITICRGNALDIPLTDGSVKGVIANSVLHLISKPEAIINEIYRVLKPGGAFITFDDKPGIYNINEKTISTCEMEENKRFDELVGFVHGEYWKRLKERNIFGKRYSWQFDREKLCGQLFNRKETFLIEKNVKVSNTFKDTFLYRMGGKGFSDQSDVPLDLHREIFDSVVSDLTCKFGNSVLETTYTYFENDEVIVVYYK